jgi:hypothetical protein
MLTQRQPSNHAASCVATRSAVRRGHRVTSLLTHPPGTTWPGPTVSIRYWNRCLRPPWAYDPCHEAAAVQGMPLAPAVTARLGGMGPGGPQTSVYAHDPCHVAAAVPLCLIGFDGHGAARLEDMEADPGNVSSGHNRD